MQYNADEPTKSFGEVHRIDTENEDLGSFTADAATECRFSTLR